MPRKRKLEVAVIETTNRCNLNCLICGSDSKNKLNPKELSSQDWCKVIDEMASLGAGRIFFSGGEPTLKPGIGDMIEHTAELGIDWGMVSNGLCISDDLLNLFQERKPVAIGLSMDGLMETHNKLRQNPNSFQQVAKNLQEFQRREIPCSIITTIHKLNYQKNLFDIAGFVLKNRIYGWQIQLAMPFGRMKQNTDLLLSQEEFLQACLIVEEIRQILPEVNISAADCFAWAPSGKIRNGQWLGCSGGYGNQWVSTL